MTRAWTTFAIAAAMLMSDGAQPTDALAQQARPDLVDPVHRGHYKRAGAGFACIIGPSEKLSPEQIKKLSEHACLRIGPLVVGMRTNMSSTVLCSAPLPTM